MKKLLITALLLVSFSSFANIIVCEGEDQSATINVELGIIDLTGDIEGTAEIVSTNQATYIATKSMGDFKKVTITVEDDESVITVIKRNAPKQYVDINCQ